MFLSEDLTSSPDLESVVLLRSETLSSRNTAIVGIVLIVILATAALAYYPQEIRLVTIFSFLVFFAIPIGCGIIILQGVRLYFDPNTRSVSWVFILVGIIILLGFTFYMNILTSLSMGD